MNIIAFFLGVFTVMVIIGLVVGVVGYFNTRKLIRINTEFKHDYYRDIDRLHVVNNEQNQNVYRDLEHGLSDLRRELDSRLDKLENKFQKDIDKKIEDFEINLLKDEQNLSNLNK